MVAICYSAIPGCITEMYDASVSIYDSIDTIRNTVMQLLQSERVDDETKAISKREKEVVKCIVIRQKLPNMLNSSIALIRQPFTFTERHKSN